MAIRKRLAMRAARLWSAAPDADVVLLDLQLEDGTEPQPRMQL